MKKIEPPSVASARPSAITGSCSISFNQEISLRPHPADTESKLTLDGAIAWLPENGPSRRRYTCTETGIQFLAYSPDFYPIKFRCNKKEGRNPAWEKTAALGGPTGDTKYWILHAPDRKGGAILGTLSRDGEVGYQVLVDSLLMWARKERVSTDAEFKAMQLLVLPRGGYSTEEAELMIKAQQYIGQVFQVAAADKKKFSTVAARLDRKRKKAILLQSPGFKPKASQIFTPKMTILLGVLVVWMHTQGSYPSRHQIRREFRKLKVPVPTNADLGRTLASLSMDWLR